MNEELVVWTLLHLSLLVVPWCRDTVPAYDCELTVSGGGGGGDGRGHLAPSGSHASVSLSQCSCDYTCSLSPPVWVNNAIGCEVPVDKVLCKSKLWMSLFMWLEKSYVQNNGNDRSFVNLLTRVEIHPHKSQNSHSFIHMKACDKVHWRSQTEVAASDSSVWMPEN